VTLLDHKVSIATTSTRRHPEEEDARRVADTFRVISLSFTNLGGPGRHSEFFSTLGAGPMRNRI